MYEADLPQLAALAAAVDEGSFDAAARRLRITPSALSQRIKALETGAGSVLLHRSRPIGVTAAGERYLRLARRIEAVIADELTDVSGDRPRLPIAINADSLATWALPALAAVADRVQLDIQREDQDHTAELLRAGTVVAALTTASEAVQGCSVSRLGVMRYRVVASPAVIERWFAGRPLREALETAPIVCFDRKDGLPDRYLSSVGVAGSSAPRHYIPAAADYLQAIDLGLGWGVAPELPLPREERGGFEVLDPHHPIDVVLHWQQWRLHTTALTLVADSLAGVARRSLRP